jgi:predicted nucleic acid-binding Zn ribbon protein
VRRHDSEDPDLRPEGAPPAPLADALGGLVRRQGWSRRLEGARVHEHWEEIAGAQLARHTNPVRLHGGVLVLEAASPMWATQVRYLAGDLVARANAVLGPGSVARVQVVSGRGTGTSGSR